jgi:hypothetical protein
MKAQVAMEFMIIFGLFLVGLTVTAISAWNSVANAERTSMDFEAKRITNMATGRINTAYLEGNGFSINMTIPERIGTNDYLMFLEGSTLMLQVNGILYSGRLLTPNITGSISKGENMVKNVNGGIVIS